MNKSWNLLLPDWSELDTVWRSPRPFCLWPIGNQPLVAHWMDEAVNQGIGHLSLYTADRPADLRRFLNDGAYWSRSLEIVPIRNDDEAPDDAIPVVGLPNDNRLSKPLEGPAALLEHWLALNRYWLDTLDEHALKIEIRYGDRGWIGPRARIHPSARLVPPFWIQGKCSVGAGAQIGPYACIGENAIIDEQAIVTNAFVLPGTLVGRNTTLDGVAVEGGLLLDSKRGCRVSITDDFILSDIGKSIKGASFGERLLALFLFTILSPVAALSRVDWSELEVHDGRGGAMTLKTGESGWLILRRWHWLKEVVKGRMRLVGILPRPIGWDRAEDEETRRRLISIPPGVLALSDVHDCHDPRDPMEWIHASYQATSVDKGVRRSIASQMWRVAFKSAS